MSPAAADSRPLGIVVNPMSGRDARRMMARASTVTPQLKRELVARVVIGAAAAGARRMVLGRDSFDIARGAVENLRIDAAVDFVEVGRIRTDRSDTRRTARAMAELGCGALVVIGGDGTNRDVALGWPDAPLVPLSTGTNNVFCEGIEATVAGAAAGLVAAGGVGLGEVACRAKVVRVAIEGEDDDLALIDAVHLVDDHLGSLVQYDPRRIRRIVLSRAEPAAIGVSPIGGLLCPAGPGDDFGVEVECVGPESAGRSLRVPISAGIYRDVRLAGWRRLELGESVGVQGPGILAFDGDRSRPLVAGQKARMAVRRDGPRVIDVGRALSLAAERGLYLDRGPWHDAYNDLGVTCC